MFKNLRIKNFRIFEHVEFAKLSHVNLLAGRNNVGKTTLLEAILLFAKLGSPAIIINILRNRDLLISENPQKPFINIPVQHLFPNSQFPTAGQSLYIGDSEKREYIDIKHTFYKLNEIIPHKDIIQSEEMVFYTPQYREIEPDNESYKTLGVPEKQKLKINYFKDGVIVKPPYSFKFAAFNSQYFDEVIDPIAYPVAYVPTNVLSLNYLSGIWDDAILSGDKSEVIQMLKLIEPSVEDVNFIKSQIDNERTAIVKLEGQREHLPLKSLGEGMSRLLQLVLSLVQAKNGFLLIDEFENGLHYSVQPKVWNMLFTLAKKLNVQIFATTHSKDTVESFGKIWKQYEDDGSFHRLSRESEQIEAAAYECTTLDYALTGDIEVR